MAFRLSAKKILYKEVPIPKLERINECRRFARLQKNTATLATAYGFRFSKNDEGAGSL